MKVFLGGIKGTSKWRDLVIPNLKIDYYNPNYKDLSRESLLKEKEAHETCDYFLYVFTPKMPEFTPIFEMIDDSNKQPEKTLFCYIEEEDEVLFTEHQIKSLDALGKMMERNGGRWFKTIEEVIDFLNTEKK